jgi:hypothetical protein
VPNVKTIRGLNIPGTPWATSACCGRPLPLHEGKYAFFDHISLHSSYNGKYFRQNYKENLKSPFMFNIFFNPAVYEIMWKNIEEVERPRVKHSEIA